MDEQGNIIIYQSEDGVIRLDVRLEEKTVWLTQQQIADLDASPNITPIHMREAISYRNLDRSSWGNTFVVKK